MYYSTRRKDFPPSDFSMESEVSQMIEGVVEQTGSFDVVRVYHIVTFIAELEV